MNTHLVEFDGVDGVISLADNNYDGLSAGTIEFWFYSAHSLTAYQKLAKKDSAIDIGITQDFGGGNCKIFAEIPGVGNLGELEEVDHADGTWRHLAITWDGTWLRGYINGIYKKRVAQSGNQNNNGNTLRFGYTGSSEPLNGGIDEIRISNIARYTVETSFQIPLYEFTDDANTLVLLHLNDGTGTNASDETGDNDGTLSGGASWSTDVLFNGEENYYVQGVFGKFRPVLDISEGTFTANQVQGVFGLFVPVIDDDQGAAAASTVKHYLTTLGVGS